MSVSPTNLCAKTFIVPGTSRVRNSTSNSPLGNAFTILAGIQNPQTGYRDWEPSAQTDSTGKFSITYLGGAGQLAAATFVATGGTDISTGKPNVLTLIAPSDTAQGPGDGKVWSIRSRH